MSGGIETVANVGTDLDVETDVGTIVNNDSGAGVEENIPTSGKEVNTGNISDFAS